MDPREKREDETWAEYGARMASMGIAPTESYFAGPTVNQFRPTGSDYTPQQLNTPIHQLQQQNIPQNVVPITPVDPTLAGMGTVGLSMIQEQVIPKTGHFGIDQNYGDFSPHMGALVDMVGNQPPAIDYGVVTDNPTRPYEPGIPFHQNMPTVTPSDQNIMPTIQGVSPQDSGMVSVGTNAFGIPDRTYGPTTDYSQVLADAGMAEVDFDPYGGVATRSVMGDDPTWPDTGGLGTTTTVDLIDLLAGSNTFGIPTLPELQDKITDATGGWSWIDHDTGFLFKDLRDKRAAEKAEQQAAAAGVDTFKDIPAAVTPAPVAAPAGPSAADIQRDKQAAVDARNAAQARQEAINAQMAQEAAARQRQQQQAVAAEQARQAQIAREVQAAQDRARQARQIMNSRDYQEGGMDNLSAAQRDIVAAAQVDTFAGMGRDGGGFDPRGGETGSSGMGAWT